MEEAHKALAQIEQMNYKNHLQARGVQDFLLMGLAFRGKEMEVVTKEVG